MRHFARVSEFESLSEQDSKAFFGGNMPTPVEACTKTVSCTVVVQTAGGSCKNNVPDDCTDTGQGSECYPD